MNAQKLSLLVLISTLSHSVEAAPLVRRSARRLWLATHKAKG